MSNDHIGVLALQLESNHFNRVLSELPAKFGTGLLQPANEFLKCANRIVAILFLLRRHSQVLAVRPQIMHRRVQDMVLLQRQITGMLNSQRKPKDYFKN